MTSQTIPIDRPAPAALPAGAWVTLFFLYLLNTMLVLDKIVFTVLLEPIKTEFRLDDFQLGLLAGSVYAVCLGLASVPMGLLADRRNRRNLAAACLAFWSLMTALCGLAGNYLMLLLARLGVGIGEAGGGPSSLSIIADLFEHRRRATAMAIFSLGTPTAALINLTLNTQISHTWGWRAVLLANSLPGLLLAVLIALIVREPARSSRKAEAAAPPLRETLAMIARRRSLMHLLGGAMVAYVVLAGVSSWNFSFLVRRYHVKLHEVGPLLGFAIAGAGMAGLLLSGRLADWLADRDERWRTRVMATTTALAVLFGLCAFNAPSWPLAVAATAGLATCATLWLAPGYALSQSLAPPRMRGTVGALLFMIANVIGYGLGPAVVGMLSDAFKAAGAAMPLQAALVCMVMLDLWAAAHFLLAGRTLRADLLQADAMEN